MTPDGNVEHQEGAIFHFWLGFQVPLARRKQENDRNSSKNGGYRGWPQGAGDGGRGSRGGRGWPQGAEDGAEGAEDGLRGQRMVAEGAEDGLRGQRGQRMASGGQKGQRMASGGRFSLTS